MRPRHICIKSQRSYGNDLLARRAVFSAVAPMIQITFQPAFDPFHSIFRLLRLSPIIERYGPLHRDHLRILDFYLLFPFRIGDIRLTPQHRKFKKLAADYATAKPYGDQPEDYI